MKLICRSLAILLLFEVFAPATRGEDARRDATVLAVERAMPSVVNISSKTVLRRRGFFFDWWRDNWSPFYQELPPQYSAGSGVIVDEEGFVLTNVHVVEDATEIEVKLSNGESYPADLVVGTRRSDVALLKIRAKPGVKFVPIQFAADDDLYLGEAVIALGNPFGLGGSVSRGILSSKTRRTTAQDGVLDMEDWIQTDAAINPGNSGGPLVNLDGNLIGLNVAIFKEGQGIGFAIPVKRISESLAEIYRPETLRSLWFGAQFRSTTNGVQAAEVEDSSPAHQAGLREGDFVLRVNNAPAKSVFGVNRELVATERKDVVLQVRRGGSTRNLTVRMQPEADHFNAEFIQRKIGMSIAPLTQKDIARMRLAIPGGFVVTEIEQDSPADHAGFQKGLILEGVDGRAFDSVLNAAKYLATKKKGETAQLNLIVPGPRQFQRAQVELKVR